MFFCIFGRKYYMYSITDIEKAGQLNDDLFVSTVFGDIMRRAVANDSKDPISEHEKDFFSEGLLTSIEKVGKLEDYSCCANYKFKKTYLIYYANLSGESEYYALKRGRGEVRLSKGEIKRDLQFLSGVAQEWLSIVNITNHSEELLQYIAKETRDTLKLLEKSKPNPIFNKRMKKYNINRMNIILRSKYFYCMALLIFEKYANGDFVSRLNNNDIEFNKYSLVHILSRHYSQTTSKNFDKSYHIEDFNPECLNLQLKDIIERIDKSGLYANESIENINFQFKGITYAIWIHKKTKGVAGKGNVEYYRIETFYPIEDAEEKRKLYTNYELKNIDSDLQIFVHK